MNITIKHVAKEAGVSVATVSRVLNNSNIVSEDAALRVKDAIKKLNYSPNSLGRNLRKCETNLILAIVADDINSHYSKVISGMQKTANKLGYEVLLNTYKSDLSSEMNSLNLLFNRTVDAAVLFTTYLDADTLTSINENYNIALCCESVKGANVLTVKVDDFEAAYTAVTALIKKGHKKIGMISTTFRVLSSIEREKGYLKALKDNGILTDEKYLYLNTYDYTSGGYAIDYFMNFEEPPTAIFAISDLLAIGAIKECLNRGMTIGKDIDIIGFDNMTQCEMFNPTISTVAQPSFEIGKVIIENLVRNINSSEKNNDTIIMPHKLILRQSTGN